MSRHFFQQAKYFFLAVMVGGGLLSTLTTLRAGVPADSRMISRGSWNVGVHYDGEKLHISLPLRGGNRDDIYVFVRKERDDPRSAPWNQNELVYFDVFNSPWWKISLPDGEIEVGVTGLDPGRVEGGRWRGELDLEAFWGKTVEDVEIAVVHVRDETHGDSQHIVSQFPGSWDLDGSLQVYEFQKLRLNSIKDEDNDGHYDRGLPRLLVSETGRDGEWRDGNYGLVRYYLDEVKKEKAKLLVRFRLEEGVEIESAEVFTNLNRRDFVVLEPEKQVVRSDLPEKNYYTATTMRRGGGGWFESEFSVEKCGAYRLQVRYRIKGSKDYVYFTDGAMRFDCAVVVSPRKALGMIVYETNPATAGGRDDSFEGRGTISSLAQTGWESIPGFSNNPLAKLLTKKGVPTSFDEDFYKSLGVNMVWVQPIHPIGREGRDINPETGKPYDPGSPYAVRDYWSVNPLLSHDNTDEAAMQEFQSAVAALDSWGVGLMMDGTFNHCAPDAVMGEGADLIGLGQYKGEKISKVRPQWFSKKGLPGVAAADAKDTMAAPDRFEFPSWTDVIEFNYGVYGELVQKKPTKHPLIGVKLPSGEKFAHLRTEDVSPQHTPYTLELWEYMSNYPRYWITRSGHPEGTPKEKSHLGIDGLRCDFAQGMPSHFWEYCINKTRNIKWDFVFMAESLDGISYDGDGKPAGVGYRSARHFDVMNENIIFYWRDHFFGYPPTPDWPSYGKYSTGMTRDTYLSRWRDMDGAVLLNNLVNHDEVFPHNNALSVFHAYAQMAALPGAPMIFYGQEVGAQNSKKDYAFTEERFGPIFSRNNFSRYEGNMGKFVPSFKSYNNMVHIWEGIKERAEGGRGKLRDLYGSVNQVRQNSKALKSEHCLFLSKWGSGSDPVDQIFAVVRADKPYSIDPQREVILAFVNNNHLTNPNGFGLFSFNLPRENGVHYAGVDPRKKYLLRDLFSKKASYYKNGPIGGDVLLSEPIEINFPVEGRHFVYFRLEEVEEGGKDEKSAGFSTKGKARK